MHLHTLSHLILQKQKSDDITSTTKKTEDKDDKVV